MKMRPSPLLLEQYIITELHYSAQQNFDGSAPDAGRILPGDIQVEVIEGVHEENALLRSCQLTIELEDTTSTKYPCIFLISLVGFFEIIKEWPEDKVDQLFSSNAPALLYSAAREALAMVTGRGPHGAILIPSVTFIQLPNDKAEPKMKELPAAKSKPLNKRPTKVSKKTTRKTAKK
jgi:preprotein translocase subunit SecB